MNTNRKLRLECQAYLNLGEVLVIGPKFVYIPTAFLVFVDATKFKVRAANFVLFTGVYTGCSDVTKFDSVSGSAV